MRAGGILQQQFELDLRGVHAARLRLVFAAVYTALRCGELSLTRLGRAIAERTSPKHGIKRIDRLLGNTKLHREQRQFYRAIARRIIAAGSRPVILVDWTAVTPKLWALVAAVPFEGRALIVYAETHPLSRYLKPHVNAAFLRRLESVLPRGCVPIIVGDAGFRSPFMKLVASMGWHCVVRVRTRAKVRKLGTLGWRDVPRLFSLARTTPTDLGVFEMGLQIRHVCRIVAVRRPLHHRPYRCRVRPHGIAALREKAAAKEPWILATSLDWSAARVVAIYALRMQIEETFRDAKSTRFGMALAYARTNSEDRAATLVLLAALTHLFAVLLGLVGEAARLQLRFQANTVTRKRVLSLAMLGRFIAASTGGALLSSALAEPAWAAFQARLSHGTP